MAQRKSGGGEGGGIENVTTARTGLYGRRSTDMTGTWSGPGTSDVGWLRARGRSKYYGVMNDPAWSAPELEAFAHRGAKE